jgi:Domain of unknown function (DUF4129)
VERGHPRPAVALAVGGTAALLVVVALASRPDGGGDRALLGQDPARVILDTTFYLLILASLLGLAIIVWAFWPRPGEELPPLPRRRRRPLAMVISSLLLVALVVALRNRHPGVLPNLAQGQQGIPGVGRSVLPPGASGGAPPGVDWVALAIVAGLLAAAGIGIWWALRRRTPVRSARGAIQGIQELLDDAVEDVMRESDPRRAVIAAWARLERVLARHGLPRHPAEAPFEYAARARAGLAIDVFSLEGLAGLFEWARFSLNEVTPAMREEALSGLLAVRDELRLAA